MMKYVAVLDIIYVFCNVTIRMQRVPLSEGRYKQAYRMVPLQPEDQHLYILGIQCQGLAYIHRILHFGLPKHSWLSWM